MKLIVLFLLVFLVFSSMLYSQTIIGQGLSEGDLQNYIILNYKTSSTLGYDHCRDTLYSKIDIKPGNLLSGIYLYKLKTETIIETRKMLLLK